jgi:cobyric acid synthase
MVARAIMFQGTGSDVGKSLIVAGLARALTLRGLKVAPFKPQNMSNNAAVTADGGEIGRAQALQARAARRRTSVHMNPVLLKPQSEIGSQVVVQGRVIGNAKANAYQAMKPQLMGAVLDSFGHLAAEADIVLVEGAGSASEINLRAGDIANMGFARATNVPVVLIGDIERGGVIASMVGSKAVLADDDAALIAGFLVNKFRGDPALFASGMAEIAARTGWDIDLAAHVRRGGRVLGICGGYQMLGQTISDPDGREGPAGSVSGLGLLEVATTLTADKALRDVTGVLADGVTPFRGYEMHIGETTGADTKRPFLSFDAGPTDGATNASGRVAGCYVHGLFSDDRLRARWLASLGAVSGITDYGADVEATLDALAAHLERHVAINRIVELARTPVLPVR